MTLSLKSRISEQICKDVILVVCSWGDDARSSLHRAQMLLFLIHRLKKKIDKWLAALTNSVPWWLVAGWLKKKKKTTPVWKREAQETYSKYCSPSEQSLKGPLQGWWMFLTRSRVCSLAQLSAPWLNLPDPPPVFLLCSLAVFQTDDEEYSPLRGWTDF